MAAFRARARRRPPGHTRSGGSGRRGRGVGDRKRTGESREYYLHWEGVDSPNNVEMIAIGVD